MLIFALVRVLCLVCFGFLFCGVLFFLFAWALGGFLFEFFYFILFWFSFCCAICLFSWLVNFFVWFLQMSGENQSENYRLALVFTEHC